MLGADGKLTPLPLMPPGGIHKGLGSSPESTAPGLSIREASATAYAAAAICGQYGYRVGATVIDAAGEARAMITGDGANGSHVFVAMRKAEVALTFAMPSSEARDLISKDHAQIMRLTPAMFVEGGAVPIFRNGKIIGAVGVSGAAGTPIGHHDEVCAAAAVRGLKKD